MKEGEDQVRYEDEDIEDPMCLGSKTGKEQGAGNVTQNKTSTTLEHANNIVS